MHYANMCIKWSTLKLLDIFFWWGKFFQVKCILKQLGKGFENRQGYQAFHQWKNDMQYFFLGVYITTNGGVGQDSS